MLHYMDKQVVVLVMQTCANNRKVDFCKHILCQSTAEQGVRPIREVIKHASFIQHAPGSNIRTFLIKQKDTVANLLA